MLDYLHLGTYHDIPVCVYDAWINRTGILDTKRRLSGPEHIYINLNNLGRKYGQKTDIYVDHTHKEVEVTIIVKGHEHIAINGEERVLSPGDLYIVNPFDQHSGFYYHSPDAYPIYAYTAIFDISFFLPLIPERYSSVFGDIARGAARFRTFSFGEERLTPLFSRLSDAYLDRDTLRLLSGTYELLAELYDHFTDKSGTGLNPDQQFVIKLT